MMIATVSLNPAVDVRYETKCLNLGGITRIEKVHKTAGGKGLNVSRVASLLGENVIATGFLGGFSGEFIRKEIKKLAFSDAFLQIEGETRTCLAVLTEDLDQTELLEPGPYISDERQEAFLIGYDKLVRNCKVIVASGSLPKGIESIFYKELIRRANQANATFLLDTSGEGLKQAIEAKPYFIKPNIQELKELTGADITSEESIIQSLCFLANKGIKLPVISRGSQGCLAYFEGVIYKVTLPEIQAVNSVGSGDAFVAGAAVALKNNFSIEKLLAFSSACGTANAIEPVTGFVNPELVKYFEKRVQISVIEKRVR